MDKVISMLQDQLNVQEWVLAGIPKPDLFDQEDKYWGWRRRNAEAEVNDLKSAIKILTETVKKTE